MWGIIFSTIKNLFSIHIFLSNVNDALSVIKYRYTIAGFSSKRKRERGDGTVQHFSFYRVGILWAISQPSITMHALYFPPALFHCVWMIQCTVHTCTHIQWYYSTYTAIYPSIQLFRGKCHISNQPGIYCYILGTKIST